MIVRTYIEHAAAMPNEGRHINAALQEDNIAVYQAYKKSIAEFAVREQQFGGPDFSLSRMSWIKTSYLWMMFRSGWGQKEGQDSILQIWIPVSFFDKILGDCVISSFSTEYYANQERWKEALASSESRMQWDPDHDPFGQPLPRKTIQLGLKGSLLNEFASKSIVKIIDVSTFVREQDRLKSAKDLSGLQIPYETLYKPADEQLIKRIKLSE